MSETGNMDNNQLSRDDHSPLVTTDKLAQYLEQTLEERAQRVQFSPVMRMQIMQKLPTRARAWGSRRRLVTSLSLACACIIVLGAVFAATHFLRSTPNGTTPPALVFSIEKALPVPTQLEHSGTFLSLDPTGQHLVYAVANQAGSMYTTNLASPVEDNRLAMEYARDASWAPDGSALVTTIYPANTSTPLLALVPTGQYMHLLGKEALASAWRPTSSNAITYVTQAQGQTTLWQIDPNGKGAYTLAVFPLPLLAQHLSWSPDGRYLAILTAADTALSATNIQGSSYALFLFDTRTSSLNTLVVPGTSTLDSLAWSPNGRILSYQQHTNKNVNTLVSFDVTQSKSLAVLPLRQQLQGMSWSPNSRVLVYSDGGTLQTYRLNGTAVLFSQLSGQAEYPFWLDSQHLLYFAHSANGGQLVRLAARTRG